jgi:DNA-binding XRE family transcriptional regulator
MVELKVKGGTIKASCSRMEKHLIMMLDTLIYTPYFVFEDLCERTAMITAAQLRAARALLGIDQKTLAGMAGVSLPTIQRMEASEGNVRGIVDTLTKVIEALNAAGIELIGEHARSDAGGRGVRLRYARVPTAHSR